MSKRRVSVWAGRGTVLVLLVAAAGCYRHSFTVGSGAPMAPVSVEQWRHHWLFGLISPDRELELSQMCPSGNATIEVEQSFLNGLVAALTGAIYSPTTVRVRCARGTASLDIEPENLTGLASDPDFLAWVAEVAPDRLEDIENARRDHVAQ
ncbi:MAG: Bor family protein [Gemmatimonadota bacterium]